MKLFIVTCDKINGPVFFKAADAQDAKIKFCNGLKTPEKYLNDPTFEILEVKLVSQILAICPDEFRLTSDASF